MNRKNNDVGAELLSLLRQQRYLYHQFGILTDRQHHLAAANSPEMLLELTSGRRKLIEKLRQLNDRLRPIKANWLKLSSQIGPEHKIQAHKIADHVRQITEKILETAESETAQNLVLNENCTFDEILVESQP